MVKTLHRDHLLPIGYLVRFPSDLDVKRLPQSPVTRLHQKEKSIENSNQEEHSEDEDENWNLPADQREDILLALDLLADHLSRDVPLENALTQHNIVEEDIDVDPEEGVNLFIYFIWGPYFLSVVSYVGIDHNSLKAGGYYASCSCKLTLFSLYQERPKILKRFSWLGIEGTRGCFRR